MRNVMSEAYEVTVLLRHPKPAVLATLDFCLDPKGVEKLFID